MNVYIETLGCSKNRVDSEIMAGTLLGDGYEICFEPSEASIIIVNTCGFLASAVEESIERILSLSQFKTEGNCKVLIAAGCLIERYRENLMSEIPELDILLGTSDYTDILKKTDEYLKEQKQIHKLKSSPFYSDNNYSANRALSTSSYAYLKIAEGCSNTCSFCNIPKLRGKQTSRSISSINNEIKELLESGYKEINLISQDCSSYGSDSPKNEDLASLIDSILTTHSQDFWLRIFYSYPNRFPIEIVNMMKNDSRLVPYIDLPLQHISDPVLKKMNRRITRREIEQLIEAILNRYDDVALRTTLIVGFPNETEKEFKELLRFIEMGYFHHLGVFCYSHEDNTTAYKYGDPISEDEKVERRDQIMEAQQKISEQKNLAMVGQIQKVLVEGRYEETDLLIKGRNRYQGPEVDGLVLINEGDTKINAFNEVEIVDAHPYDLIGRIKS